jgi:16S rRNA processing protein RimM
MVTMGRVAGPFGVRGWIKVQPFTALPDGLLGYPAWWLGRAQGQWTSREVETAAVHGRALVAKLKGCDTREESARLKGLDVGIPRSQLPSGAPGEYYWADLLGLQVRNQQSEPLGRVVRLMETGANDVLVVQEDHRQRLIPFVSAVVVTVDLVKGEMVVDWGVDF